MTKKEFLRVVSCFLQDPEAIVANRNQVVFSNGDAEYSVELKVEDSEITEVTDKAGGTYKPLDWISRRLAHLENLARAIQRQFEDSYLQDKYVATESVFEDSESGLKMDVENTEDLLYERIHDTESCQTSVYFLTSEAGDGKTMLMRRLAVRSADEFLKGHQNWLFVPIELGGKPFLRLDEFILGSLNRFYRYSLYLEAFTELVRRGRIVLGLDGFEESAVQGADGDVISSLGSLLASLDSQGCVVFASRKAFYFHSHLHDYSTFAELAKSYEVGISEIRIKQWGRRQAVAFAQLCGLDQDKATSLYDHLRHALGETCPLLVRAVLAHKFISELVDSSGKSLNEILSRFQERDEATLVHLFIAYLLERETRKLVRSNTDITPILSSEGHESILRTMADEMWKTDTESLSVGTVAAIIELMVENHRLTPDELNRCRAHVPHHALLAAQRDGSMSFCHLDFYHYFLGASIAATLEAWTDSPFDVYKILDRKPLPSTALKECVRRIRSSGQQELLRSKLCQLRGQTQRGTPLGQNVASLLLLLHRGCDSPIELSDMYCSEFALRTPYLNQVLLTRCFIEKCDLTLMAGAHVTFAECEFPRAEYFCDAQLSGLVFDEASVPRVLVRSATGEKPDVGDRAVIRALLRRAGAVIRTEEEISDECEFEEDELTQIFFKVILVFDLWSALSENVLKSRLGKRYSTFKNEVCPQMLKLGVLEEETYRGRNVQRRFRLKMRGEQLAQAREKARGDFAKLLKSL